MSRYLTLTYAALIVWLVVDLVVVIVARDWWRTAGFALVIVFLLGLRRELTTVPQ